MKLHKIKSKAIKYMNKKITKENSECFLFKYGIHVLINNNIIENIVCIIFDKNKYVNVKKYNENKLNTYYIGDINHFNIHNNILKLHRKRISNEIIENNDSDYTKYVINELCNKNKLNNINTKDYKGKKEF